MAEPLVGPVLAQEIQAANEPLSITRNALYWTDNSCWVNPVLMILMSQWWDSFRNSVLLTSRETVELHIAQQRPLADFSTYLQGGAGGCLDTWPEEVRVFLVELFALYKDLRGNNLIACRPGIRQFLARCGQAANIVGGERLGGPTSFGNPADLVEFLLGIFYFGTYTRSISHGFFSEDMKELNAVNDRLFNQIRIQTPALYQTGEYIRFNFPAYISGLNTYAFSEFEIPMLVLRIERSLNQKLIAEERIQLCHEDAGAQGRQNKWLVLRGVIALTTGRNHWVSWIKDQLDDQWYFYDDQIVRGYGGKTVLWGSTLYDGHTREVEMDHLLFGGNLFFYDVRFNDE